MKIYWQTKDVPELAPLSTKDRRVVVRYCFYRFTFRHWQCWMALLINAACYAVGVIMFYLLRWQLGWLAAFLLAFVPFIIGAIVLGQVCQEQLRPHYRDYIEKKIVKA